MKGRSQAGSDFNRIDAPVLFLLVGKSAGATFPSQFRIPDFKSRETPKVNSLRISPLAMNENAAEFPNCDLMSRL